MKKCGCLECILIDRRCAMFCLFLNHLLLFIIHPLVYIKYNDLRTGVQVSQVLPMFTIKIELISNATLNFTVKIEQKTNKTFVFAFLCIVCLPLYAQCFDSWIAKCSVALGHQFIGLVSNKLCG